MSYLHDLPRTAVPRGVASFLPDLAARKRQLESRALRTFRQWGYREVAPPLFEYLEVLSQGLVPETVARGYKIEDRQDGRLMVLRPDITAQVARLAAARQEDPHTPHRFGYTSNVFTQVEAHSGQPREVFQVGVELLGPGGVEADLEVLSLLISLLQEIGLGNFVVALGQSGFVQGVLTSLNLPEDARAAMTQAVHGKDIAAIRGLLQAADADEATCAALERIPFLIGEPEVIDTGRSLTTDPSALAALDHLQTVVDGLTAAGLGKHLLIDLGEIRDLSYYTGVVFEVLDPSMGVELGGGGRYDDLVGRFGHPMDAIGFALDVERVMEAQLRAQGPVESAALDYRVVAAQSVSAPVRQLREAGLQVGVVLPGEATEKVPLLQVTGDQLTLCREGASPEPVDVAALIKHAGR